MMIILPRGRPDPMSILDHNVYENVRTRIIVLHKGCLLLLPPQSPGISWRPPGGGLEPHESLAECAIREVYEETGLKVRLAGIAFLREWVVPEHCFLPIERGQYGYGLEVYFYAFPSTDQIEPRRENETRPIPQWVSLEEVPELALWPKELKAIAIALKAGEELTGITSFVTNMGPENSIWAKPGAVKFNFQVSEEEQQV